ncbi:TOBE domain-containing protein [Nanchangia anserum]|uniref:TOBE domain-containing protein n=1 Tax=Nanchangia anserum TaxID=2692125 RepID=A0A8I0KNA1_9ACTO|nr:TOBE domain-containing protein [Nanchangia anserum]MBD3689061.1 TOBE domain-containing protein [Nanchangia anserum]QOX81302.1 TOBE domain-containing protein [Nanchangia anserum]
MPSHKVSTLARLLSVSTDTVRRWIDDGHIELDPTVPGPQHVDGASVVRFLTERPELHAGSLGRQSHSMRNHMPGLVIDIVSDTVMSQVVLQCGPFRIVSLVSTEAVTELGLSVGSVAIAQVKATNVSLAVSPSRA